VANKQSATHLGHCVHQCLTSIHSDRTIMPTCRFNGLDGEQNPLYWQLVTDTFGLGR
jgi:hypothetical protein